MKTIKPHELWLLFAGLCLSVSGVLSLPIFLGKVPALAAYLPSLEWTQWSLVIHVILALVLWHLAVPVGITCYFGHRPSAALTRGSVALCALGSALMFFAVPSEESRPLLTNYIPVITDAKFVAGLFLCLAGILGGFLSSGIFVNNGRNKKELFPLRLGICFYLAALVFFGAALYSKYDWLMAGKYSIVEQIVWGPGHLLQHLSSVFLIAAWLLLLSPSGARKGAMFKEFLPAFLVLGASLLYLPFLFERPITGAEYRAGFTALMRWGIFPAFIVFFALLWRHRRKFKWKEIHSFRLLAFGFSSLLLIVGFVFGALIDGHNLKVPGHYHATIGSVTIAFMAVFIHFFKGRYPFRRKRVKTLFWSYGIGQILFSSGLFVAGCFQVERKTYGAQLELANLGKKVGIGIVGVGGTFALIGGICFVVVFFKIARNILSVEGLKAAPEDSLAAPERAR